MTLSKNCLDLFGTKDLYKVLQLDRGNSLTESKIKKAYYQQSILWHPDRFSSSQHNDADKNLATKKFQVISKAYLILGDKEKRRIYDETGNLDDEDSFEDKDWVAAWRGMFKKVTKEDIEEYLRKFRGSEREMEDIKQAYIKHKGDMNKILSTVIGADVKNEDRIREIIRYFIDNGQVEAYPKYVNEPPSARIRRIKTAEKESKEAEKVLKEMQKKAAAVDGAAGSSGGAGDLHSLILGKQKRREEQQVDFLAHLEEKYGGKGQPKRKKERNE